VRLVCGFGLGGGFCFGDSSLVGLGRRVRLVSDCCRLDRVAVTRLRARVDRRRFVSRVSLWRLFRVDFCRFRYVGLCRVFCVGFGRRRPDRLVGCRHGVGRVVVHRRGLQLRPDGIG